jgi:predicted site-specific integrase-resolvase
MAERRPAPGFGDYPTIKQAAERLSVSAETMRNWDRAGKLKPLRHSLNATASIDRRISKPCCAAPSKKNNLLVDDEA